MALTALRKACDRCLESVPQKQKNDCLLWHPEKGFKPNPGAQQILFTQHTSLDPSQPNPSTFRWIYYRAGIGAGKSFSGASFICCNAKRDRNARQLITANSYGQLRTSTLVALAEFCKRFRVPLDPIADIEMDSPEWADLTAKRIALNRFCTVFGAPVLVLSAEAFTGRTESSTEVGRGLQIRGAWADEFSYADESAFTTLNGRLGRGPGTMRGIGLITSSINKNNPYNWCYNLFDSPDRTEDQQRMFISIKGSSRENIHADADYFTSIAAGLTTELAQIELEGEYAATTEGRVAQYFVRSLHVQEVGYNPNHPLHLSLDFNYSPSTAIACQFYDNTLFVIREWFMLNAGTFELSADLSLWVRGLEQQERVELHGDASGNQKTANSRKTNWQIVHEALRAQSIAFGIRYGKANPEVQDTINSLNCGFKADRIIVSSGCKELVKDLESLQYNEKGEIDKKRDLQRSHLFDGLRYIVNDLMPMAKRPTYTSSFTAKPK